MTQGLNSKTPLRAHATFALSGMFLGAFVAEFFIDPGRIRSLALTPSRVIDAMSFADPLGLAMATLTMFTSMFLHASWSHLLGNCLGLFLVGIPVERTLGSRLTALLYVGGGLFAALVYVMSAAFSDIPMIGGSGGITALMAVYFGLLISGKAGGDQRWRIVYGVFIMTWLALNLYNQYLEDTFQQTTWIAYWVNTGGFVAGLFLVTVLCLHRPRSSAGTER